MAGAGASGGDVVVAGGTSATLRGGSLGLTATSLPLSSGGSVHIASADSRSLASSGAVTVSTGVTATSASGGIAAATGSAVSGTAGSVAIAGTTSAGDAGEVGVVAGSSAVGGKIMLSSENGAIGGAVVSSGGVSSAGAAGDSLVTAALRLVLVVFSGTYCRWTSCFRFGWANHCHGRHRRVGGALVSLAARAKPRQAAAL